MNRLHGKGLIHNRVGKAKSFLLTEEYRRMRAPVSDVRQGNLMCPIAVSRRKPLRFEMTACRKMGPMWLSLALLFHLVETDAGAPPAPQVPFAVADVRG